MWCIDFWFLCIKYQRLEYWQSSLMISDLAELQNVNSFTRSKTLELNFTPRKARKSRQFWDLSETKLTKMIVLENKCWQLFQIRLVYTQKSYINCANLFKIGLIWSYCVFSQTFYLNLQILLHRYIRHICDISQLCTFGTLRWRQLHYNLFWRILASKKWLPQLMVDTQLQCWVLTKIIHWTSVSLTQKNDHYLTVWCEFMNAFLGPPDFDLFQLISYCHI